MNLLTSPNELKNKLYKDLTHEKKYKALNNYASCNLKFKHREYLPLLRRALDCGFLGEKEDEFLGYLIDRYSLPYLDWAHKTNWLKNEMELVAGRQSQQPTPPQQKHATVYDLFSMPSTRLRDIMHLMTGPSYTRTWQPTA